MTAPQRRVVCAVTSLLLVVALPAAAQAAQKTVNVGVPRASQKALQPTFSDVNDFFPHRVTIHVGDTVRFVPSGFHTVDLPGRRTRKLPIVTPLAQPIANSVDAAGAPFWFNGQRNIGFNPALLRSGFGKRFRYTGGRAVLSGLPLARRPQPMTVRFARAGTFRYFCDVHLGMTGIVRVVRANRSIPSAAADRATVRRQVASTLATAKALAASTPATPPATVDTGLQGRGGVSFFGFKPNAMTVPTGTTVTFRMAARSEVHTATAGPGDPENQPTSYLGQVAALQGPVFDPRSVYPSEPPGALGVLSPTFHGNGFWGSGALDEDPATPTVPPTSAVRFGAPGTYTFFCMIHPIMKVVVTVQ
jgi:plastocyanin